MRELTSNEIEQVGGGTGAISATLNPALAPLVVFSPSLTSQIKTMFEAYTIDLGTAGSMPNS